MNQNNTHAGILTEVAETNENPSPAWVELAQNGDSPNPPNLESASSIDILVEILTRRKDAAATLTGHTGNWREVFLQALARAPIVTVAARIAGVPRARAIAERYADGEFADRWDDAIEQGIDEIEAAAYLSAVYGDRRPLFQQRKQIGWTVEYFHATRSMLLKAWRSRVFGKKEKENPKKAKTPCMTLAEFEKRMEEAKAGPAPPEFFS